MEYIEQRGFSLGKGEYPADTGFERGLSNDLLARDQFNAVFFSEMGKELGIITYLAGNIPALTDMEHERSVQQAVYRAGCDYNRFISFAFNPKIITVLKLKEEESYATESRSIGTETNTPGT